MTSQTDKANRWVYHHGEDGIWIEDAAHRGIFQVHSESDAEIAIQEHDGLLAWAEQAETRLERWNQLAPADFFGIRERAENAELAHRQAEAAARIHKGALKRTVERNNTLVKALRKSVERFHDLAEFKHKYHEFEECPESDCAKARSVLEAVSE